MLLVQRADGRFSLQGPFQFDQRIKSKYQLKQQILIQIHQILNGSSARLVVALYNGFEDVHRLLFYPLFTGLVFHIGVFATSITMACFVQV